MPILVLVLTSAVYAQTDPSASVATARELYASADYRAALDVLDRLAATNPTAPERQSIDLYRTLCLVALGRMQEADETIAAMITRDPLFRPAVAEIPPRQRPMFSDKRKALLPAIIQSRYEQAKESFDRSDFRTAVDGFTEVLMAIAAGEIAAQARLPPLSDLRVLAVGFKDLALREMALTSALAPTPPAPESQPRMSEAPKIVSPKIPRIYDSNDAGVVGPITVRQELPRFQRPVMVERTGVLFIVIDETDAVESAIITEPLDPACDRIVLDAAKTWRYQPATRNGMGVKYRKRLQLTLPRQTN
jgi:hypothetical protein